MPNILIVGGGFGGVQAARALAKKKLPDTTVRLIDPKTHFEYTAALYRFVTGRSPMESCISYKDILGGYDVDVIQDAVTSVNVGAKVVSGQSGSSYYYDTLILALGSETSYFGIQGIKEYAHGMRSTSEAIRLKAHILDVIVEASTATKDSQTPLLHLVIVGGGASGVELAGELGWYTASLAKNNNLDPSLITIDLIEAMPRILPMFTPEVSAMVTARLRSLGVNVMLNRSLVKEDMERVYLKDMQMTTKTVVWTAGVMGHSLLKNIAGLTADKRGRIEVDDQLKAKGQSSVFAIGDAASTKFSGMAQTALIDGDFVADVIEAEANGKKVPVYVPSQPKYAVPVGPKWAVVVIGKMTFMGYLGWALRRAADLRVFLTLLPLMKALRAFRSISDKE